MTLRFTLLTLMMLMLLSCGGGKGSSSDSLTPPSQGTRTLGMNVKEIPSVTYAVAYNQAIAIGAREVSVSLDWSLLEPSVGSYDNSLPSIINAFYPAQAADLALVLRPLDTPGPSLPSELSGLAYDDPLVIAAFENFLKNLHAQLPTLNASGKLKWIQIGNEVDAYLGNNPIRWAQWQNFFQAAKKSVRDLWGAGVEVSSIVQFSVLNNADNKALYLQLLPDLDNATFTYYPLNNDFTMRPTSSVAGDFALMTNAISGKNILLQECGYPSSQINNSSESQQADFISAVFEAWDKNRDRIRLIDLAWQYDVSSTTVDQWVILFGMTTNPNEAAFRSYLGTLGLANYDGSEKAAMQRLRYELQARQWER